MARNNVLDGESRRFQEEVDALVRQWAKGDDREYWRRWKQLGSWSINKTQGDVVKKAALKKQLMKKTSGRCEDCDRRFEQASLQMHRIDQSFAHDRSTNFGYFDSNVVLVCAACHERRESGRR